MKKFLIALLCAGMLLSIAGCTPRSQPTEASTGAASFDSLSQSVQAMLMEMGYTPESWAAVAAQEQQAILTAVNALLREDAATNTTQATKPAQLTLADVEAGGRYLVTVSDSMMWNYFELYYLDGVLTRIYVNFSKDGSEEDIMDIKGDDIQQFGLFFIDYTAGATAVVNALAEQGYDRVFIAKR